MICKLLLPTLLRLLQTAGPPPQFRRHSETRRVDDPGRPGLLVAWSIFLLPVREPENACRKIRKQMKTATAWEIC